MPEIQIRVLEILKAFGSVEGLFLIIILILHFAVFGLYKANIKGKQGEIDRMAEDVKDLRKNLIQLMDLYYNDIKSRINKSSHKK
jgi:hypothetical protein